jgi:outer membrane PBP1 activator LpoA protein
LSVKHSMRDSNTRHHNQARVIVLILLSLLLWGCAGKPKKETPEPTPEAQKESAPVQQPDVSATLPASHYSAVFNSAEQSLARFDWMQASVTLLEIPADGMTPNDRAYTAYLQARITYIRGDQVQALTQLDQLNFLDIHPALRYRILSFKHYVLEMQGDSLASAQLADQMLRLAPRNTLDAWKRSIWLNLERTDKQQLLTAQSHALDPRWRGWLELALICRDSIYDPSSELVRWRNSYPDHPARDPLPGGLSYQMSASVQSNKVAILLPLSGKLAPAGKAVLSGFLAAYYAHSIEGGASDELLVIDVDKHPSASSAYDEAVSQGASMVVGPLSKESLANLATRLERPIPILALNRIDQVLPATGSALVQLSLSPEDDAASIAELAFGTGARRALIITPSGDWGSKMETTLRDRWTKLGGTIVRNATYTTYDDYSSSVKSALSLEASEQRARDLRTVLGTDIEFTPRRRQDPDVVFLLSNSGAEARSIKPLLAFHYAGDLPVFALSNIYNGVPDERNQDLNGIYLAETPWLLGSNPGLRVTIAAGDIGSNYTRLNALGADAFLVQSGFTRLQGGADALFRGNTGLLSMDPDLIIRRELSVATFDGGVLQAP